MNSFPQPAAADSKHDVRAFFNDFATRNYERHGPADEELRRRVEILDRTVGFEASDVVLDLGCGDGKHLRAVADRIDRGIGVDFAPNMIDTARRRTQHASLSYRVDDAETLATFADGSVDVVICTGVLEHVLHPARLFAAVRRVLRPGGRFAALTLNGRYWWYRLADRLGIPTRHLATDRRLRPEEAVQFGRTTGLQVRTETWAFVPRGDLSPWLAACCRTLEAMGRYMLSSYLRGGLVIAARHPRSPESPENPAGSGHRCQSCRRGRERRRDAPKGDGEEPASSRPRGREG
jgi:2-polyprenyl-6-hydroxyphenyl methylase/3-demethylubiquinone-9 3-methyltransferase